jgi:hypothetical protein
MYWKYRYVDKLVPIATDASLENGKAFHEAMETYYIALRDGTKATDALLLALTKLRSFLLIPEENDKLENALRMYSGYYADDPYFKVIEAEQSYEHLFEIKVKRNTYHRNVKIFLTGRVDLVVEWNKKIYIVDHKTTKWIVAKTAEANALSDQATGYIALWNAAHPDQPATGAIYNIIKLSNTIGGGNPDKDLRREIVYRSQGDIDSFLLDIAESAKEIQRKLTKPFSRFVKDRNACFLYNKKCQYADLCAGADPGKLLGITYKIDEGLKGDTNVS